MVSKARYPSSCSLKYRSFRREQSSSNKSQNHWPTSLSPNPVTSSESGGLATFRFPLLALYKTFHFPHTLTFHCSLSCSSAHTFSFYTFVQSLFYREPQSFHIPQAIEQTLRLYRDFDGKVLLLNPHQTFHTRNMGYIRKKKFKSSIANSSKEKRGSSMRLDGAADEDRPTVGTKKTHSRGGYSLHPFVILIFLHHLILLCYSSHQSHHQIYVLMGDEETAHW